MEGFVEGNDPGEVSHLPRPPPPPASGGKRMTTRAGSGTAGMAGMLAARSSGAADAIGPVHGAYGLAVEEEAEDLLSSHMKFILR